MRNSISNRGRDGLRLFQQAGVSLQPGNGSAEVIGECGENLNTVFRSDPGLRALRNGVCPVFEAVPGITAWREALETGCGYLGYERRLMAASDCLRNS